MKTVKKTFGIVFAITLILQCSGQSVCTTSECEREAETMLSKIDDSIGICDNFYDFACGKYKPDIPNHKIKIDELGNIQDTLQERLNEVMSAAKDSDDIEPFRTLKTFYQNCIDKDTIEKLGLKTLVETLNLMGGWPVTLDSWAELNWSWQKMTTDLELLGFPTNFLFEFSITPNQKNTSTRVLGIDQPLLGISREYLIEGLGDKIVQAYHSYQVDMAVMFEANRTIAEKEMMEALHFEIELAKLSLAREDRRNSSKLYNPISLKNFQQKFPSLDWVEYFNTVVDIQPAINEYEIIIVSNETLFVKLNELLQTTPKRTIANYMMWRATLSVSGLLHDVIRNRALEFGKIQSGKKEYEPRWKECVGITAKYLSIATGAIYVRKYFNEESKKAATEMIQAIRSAFEETLKTVTWMDEKTRAAALYKVEKMENHIAYPNELMDDAKLIKFHEKAEVPEHDYLRSVLNMNYFRLKSETKKLREPINKTDWETKSDVAIANAYYGWFDNSILIPAGILQGQFFAADRPRYMNFASIGLVIGHEITHGFDDQGRQYDSDGNLVEWWEKDTKKAYLEKAQCIIEQYGNYTEPHVGLKLNGINTQGENIADNGGVITAYRAYQKWVSENGAELPLSVLNFTSNQLFWLSAGQTWCSVFRPEELKMRIITGVHSINRFRIIGPLSNMQEFADDFNCPKDSSMNPTSKCKVW